MTDNEGASPALTFRGQASELILKRLGARRVAEWCGVAEATVYQWLHRGTEDEPIPANRVGAILAGAQREKLDAPLAILSPALARAMGVAP